MIPRYIFSEEHELFRESVRRFIAAEITPHHRQWEKDGKVSREVWLKAGAAGFLCPNVPAEYGGPGADLKFNAILTEELGRAGARQLPNVRLGLSHNLGGVPYNGVSAVTIVGRHGD